MPISTNPNSIPGFQPQKLSQSPPRGPVEEPQHQGDNVQLSGEHLQESLETREMLHKMGNLRAQAQSQHTGPQFGKMVANAVPLMGAVDAAESLIKSSSAHDPKEKVVDALALGSSLSHSVDSLAQVSRVAGYVTRVPLKQLGGVAAGVGCTLDGIKTVAEGVHLEKGHLQVDDRKKVAAGGLKTVGGGMMTVGAATLDPVLVGAGAVTYGSGVVVEHSKEIKHAARWMAEEYSKTPPVMLY